MPNLYDQYWVGHTNSRLRRAVFASITVHVALVVALSVSFARRERIAASGVYQVQLLNEAPSGAPDAASPPPEPEPEPPPPPPPPPPKEVPKPKEPEKTKEEPPKPKPPEKKPEPKVEAKKEEKKPEKPKEPKPVEKPKEEPKPERTQVARREEPKLPVAPVAAPGVSMAQALPSALGAWGGLVQRKVDRAWLLPEGVRLGPKDDVAVISFWVSRDGRLLGEPSVVRQASDPEVAASAVRAVKAGAPYPPLPESYQDTEVQVVCTFTPVR